MMHIDPPKGYDAEAHDRHIASGKCPVVDESTKAWCNNDTQPHDRHWAIFILPNKMRRAESFSTPRLIRR